ncbi:MAG: SAM-dependent chlorinase/fluorinase, partial [Flavobacteriaceae bacterium]|nr:SAM-dependent chlorinase/fluorinase [Flavobacteriaceae bacterium]
MGIITLTTDFGLDDFHVASLKGTIYSQLPEVTIVDISHQIMPFDLIQTAYILQNSYKNFPKGTIHIIGVDALPSPYVKPIAAEINGHFFICNDNGILSLTAGEFIPDQLI